MKTNPIFTRVFLAAGLLLGGACIFFANDAQAATASKGDRPSKPSIAQGMSADEVRKNIGEPRTIKQIKSEELSAESWIYRRKIRTETTQEVVGDTQNPAWIGFGMGDANALGTVSVPVYRLKHTTIYQVTALLMVDGTMMEARQWLESEVNYEG